MIAPAAMLLAALFFVARRPGSKRKAFVSVKENSKGKEHDKIERDIKGEETHLARVERKRSFLQRAGDDYGYTQTPAGFIDNWRSKEFPQMVAPVSLEGGVVSTASNEEQEVYLDYGGAALPSRSQLDRIHEAACGSILANPHSSGPAASRTLILIEQAKKRILDHFHAGQGRFAGMSRAPRNSPDTQPDDFHSGYEIVFTSGATESLRIIAELFPWSPHCEDCGRQSTLVYPQNAHTSVVGVRGAALAQGARFHSEPLDDLLQSIAARESVTKWERAGNCDDCCSCKNSSTVNNLLILPLECNFGGDRPEVRTAIQHVQAASSASVKKNSRWSTMLDLAKAASTGPVNLRELNPDFACLSFYKMFGEPTGLGCLFVKRASIDVLMGKENNRNHKGSESLRHYFGGGSVDAVLPRVDFGVRRSEPTSLASLANGTVHFRGIASLRHGFDEFIRMGGMTAIKQHTTTLAAELVRRMRSLEHDNGRPAVAIYGAWATFADGKDFPGPTVAFNVLRDDGTYVGYNEVSKLAALNRPPLQLRTGCFCNPGACQLALELSDEDVLRNYRTAGHVCGDQIDVIDGRPTGAIRASFGKESIWEDMDALVVFMERLFVSRTGIDGDLTSDARWDGGSRQVVLSELYLFPIKSCAAQRVKRWALDSVSGKLALDREFALVDSSGTAMRLQVYPKMAFLQPVVDLERRTMTVSAPGRRDLELNLDEESKYDDGGSIVKVCGNRCGGILWGNFEASEWFSEYLGVRCWLARHSDGHYHLPDDVCAPGPPLRSREVAFANEQPLLLISEHAVDALNDVLTSHKQGSVSSRHFRPNMVVRLVGQAAKSLAHAEDGWSRLSVEEKDIQFDVVGQCARCSMVDVDPSTGMKGKTLRALADYRRRNGQIIFGIFLRGRSNKTASLQKEVLVEEGDIVFCE